MDTQTIQGLSVMVFFIVLVIAVTRVIIHYLDMNRPKVIQEAEPHCCACDQLAQVLSEINIYETEDMVRILEAIGQHCEGCTERKESTA